MMTDPLSSSPGTPGHPDSRSEAAKQEARGVVNEATSSASAVGEVAKDEAATVAAEAKYQTRDLLHQSRRELMDQASQQQTRAAEGLRSIHQELSSMAAHSDREGVGTDLVRQAAEKAGSFADYLDRRDPGSLLNEVKAYARRRPGAFLAIAAGAGLLAGRLSRSLAAGPTEDDARGTQYAGDQYRGTPYAAGQYGEGQYDRQYDGRYAGGQYAGDQYVGAQYGQGQYTEGQYGEGQYGSGVSGDGAHTGGLRPQPAYDPRTAGAQTAGAQAAGGQYGTGQYGEGQYGAQQGGQYGTGQYGAQQGQYSADQYGDQSGAYAADRDRRDEQGAAYGTASDETGSYGYTDEDVARRDVPPGEVPGLDPERLRRDRDDLR
jgi:hypothetical protein